MKKLVILVVAAIMSILNVFAISSSSVLLQHEGNVTEYNPENFLDALEAAVENDTIFLSEGSFSNFTLSKPITIIGAGKGTCIEGDVTINILSTNPLKSAALQNLVIGTLKSANTYNLCNLNVKSSNDGLQIRQCVMYNLTFNGVQSNVILDRCDIRNNLSTYNRENNTLKSMTANNCKIKYLYCADISSNEINYVNCNIRLNERWSTSSISNDRGTFVNCIMTVWDNGTLYDSSVSYSVYSDKITFANDAILGDGNHVVTSSILDDDMNCVYTPEQMVTNGFIGNDGTAIGAEGGATPFTLAPQTPTVEKAEVSLNNETKILNVDITLVEK